jgi:hypothetical protein
VLQQAGLQLLQALAAPLQQLQLSSPGDALLHSAAAWQPGLAAQLHVLRAAAVACRALMLLMQSSLVSCCRCHIDSDE